MCNRYRPARGSDPTFDRLGPPIERYPPSPFGRIGPFGLGVFIRPLPGGSEAVLGQWGLIRPGARERRSVAKDGRPLLTNNARSETIDKLPTYRDAWQRGQRCIIPALGYDEPNWETGRNVWWQMRRADGQAWGVAGLWSTWSDPVTGEVVETYTMPTINVDGHPLLSRLHRLDPQLPAGAQDKRAIVPLQADNWDAWLRGSNDAAAALLRPLPAELFDAGPVQLEP